MAFPNISEVKQEALRRLDRAGNSTRLIALHSGIPAIISLVLTVISFLLSRQIEGTGGLDGLGMRSVLEAAQEFLQIGSMAFSTFWAMSLVQITLSWARGEETGDRDLLSGFRHWAVVLRSAVLKLCVFCGGALLAGQISALIYTATPMAADLTALVDAMMTDPNFMPTDAEMMDAVRGYLPFLGITLALFLIPIFYRLRMMDYLVMTYPKMGARNAMRMSVAMTRRNCFKLLRLDLSFWWFYLLEVLTAVVYYGDWIAQLFGLQIQASAEIVLFVCCALGLALQFGLYVWRQARVATTYALVFESLLPRPQETAGAAEIII